MLRELTEAFLLGLATPLTALCVLPLYPGFVAYLANRLERHRSSLLFGLFIVVGIMLFMLLVGFLFTYLLEVSLTAVIEIISPLAFGILALFSIFLLLDKDVSRWLPRLQSPRVRNPYVEALLFGLFFGAIVLPCNPGLIALLFAKVLAQRAAIFGQFLAFGLGMGFPLLVLAGISTAYSNQVISFLTRHRTVLNRLLGALMLLVSLYYLLFVFGPLR